MDIIVNVFYWAKYIIGANPQNFKIGTVKFLDLRIEVKILFWSK
jgi:hypothetical protein